MPDEFDFSAMLRQAQDLQQKLKQIQLDAGEKTVDAQSGGGMVRVVVDGAMRVRKIEIDPVDRRRRRQGDDGRFDRGRGQRRATPRAGADGRGDGQAGPMAGMNLPGIFGGGRG